MGNNTAMDATRIRRRMAWVIVERDIGSEAHNCFDIVGYDNEQNLNFDHNLAEAGAAA